MIVDNGHVKYLQKLNKYSKRPPTRGNDRKLAKAGRKAESAEKWGGRAAKAGRFLGKVGGALTFADGFRSQWVDDSGDHGLSTWERIARGSIRGGGAVLGGYIGGSIGEGVGFEFGGPVGAVGGSAVGQYAGATLGGYLAGAALRKWW
ncbi:hypothetical protein ACFQVD_08690 [Streptosporangium amethystogenes subsp. fukuiense]|uniref:Uncharacterized protein n=1 Tax=Streptosporangium amethystogenes subsp. fukuiense TaxID=698418 RepID=A0ABW2SXI1_9ACTN